MNAPLAHLLVEAPAAPPCPIVMPQAVCDAALVAAEAVDTEGRFPAEAVTALRQHGLLAALIPVTLGGGGLTLRQVAGHCQALGAACSSAAMVLAMHHSQVACLVRHAAGEPWMAAFLRRVADGQLLLASATSERATSGDLRNSACALVWGGGGFSLEKDATSISYGAYADAILVTTRASAEAPPGDQVLAVLERDDYTLEKTAAWDALGMRGTMSEGFVLRSRGLAEQVVQAPFSDIASATMTPVSHIVWASAWLGIAGEAVERARRRLRKGAGRGAVSASALRLVAAVELLQLARGVLRTALDEFDWDEPRTPGFAEAVASNALKAGVADACLAAAHHALAVCGAAGYGRAGPASVSRQVRDLQSAPLMIANERLRETSARLVLAQAPRLSLD